MLCATSACLFEQLNCQKFCEPQVFFYVLTWTCVSHHSGSNFSLCSCSFLRPPDGSTTAALASLLVNPPAPQNIGKTKFRGVSTFSLALIFFLLTLSSLILSAPTASSAHTVGSFTSKLPWAAGYSSIRRFQCTNVLSSVYPKTKL